MRMERAQRCVRATHLLYNLVGYAALVAAHESLEVSSYEMTAALARDRGIIAPHDLWLRLRLGGD